MSDETIWSLLVKIEADASAAKAAVADMDRRFGKLESSASRSTRNVGAGLRQMGRGAGQLGHGLDQLGTRAAIGAAAGLGFVVKAAIDFEDSFSGVRKTVDATDKQLDELKSGIRGMAREIPISANTLNELAESAGALGVGFDAATGKTNVGAIKEFTRVSALLGVTTNVSAQDAATSLGVLSNVLGLTENDYERFGSTLVDLGNKGASTEADILKIAERAGAGAKLIHAGKAETLGWASAVANLGIEAEAGGTSLQTFFQKSLSYISKGGDKLKVYAKTAGMSEKAFKKLFDKDSSQALQTFIDGLGDLDEAARLKALDELGFKDVRIQRMLLGLAGNTDNLTDSLNIANAAWEKNSALGDEAAKKFDTTASQLQILKNNVQDAAITLGDKLLPVFNEVIKGGVKWLIDHQADIEKFGTSLADGIGQFVDELQGTDWTPLLGGMKLAAETAKGAFDAFNALPDPVKQLAIAALVANKVSGGAVMNIAKGLANLIGGAMRTIMAGNVTVIGANVTGGAPGGPGGVPGGKPGGVTPGQLLRFGGGALLVAGGTALHAQEDQASQFGGALGQIGGGALAGSAFGPVGTLVGTAVGSALAVAQQGVIFNDQVQGGKAQMVSVIEDRTKGATITELAKLRTDLETQMTNEMGNPLDGILKWAFVNNDLQKQIDDVDAQIRATAQANKDEQAANRNNIVTTFDRGAAAAEQASVLERVSTDRVGARLGLVEGAVDANTTATRAIPPGLERVRGTIDSKNFSPTVKVTNVLSINVDAHVRQVVQSQQQRVAATRGSGFARYADGTMDVPMTGLAMLHEHEMVIPPQPAEAMRRHFERMAGDRIGDGDVYNITVPVQGLLYGRSSYEIGSDLRRLGEEGKLVPRQRLRNG